MSDQDQLDRVLRQGAGQMMIATQLSNPRCCLWGDGQDDRAG